MTGTMARHLNVGIVLSSSEAAGGAFVQSLNIARLLSPQAGDPYSVEYIALDQGDRERISNAGLDVATEMRSPLSSVFTALSYMPAVKRILRRIYPLLFGKSRSLDRLAAKKNYDLLVFTAPSRLAMGVRRTPFVFTIWDLCHLDHPEFPEIAADDSFSWRENLFSGVLPRASAYIVDSRHFGDRVAQTYGLDNDKALVVPFHVSQDMLKASVTYADIAKLRKTHSLTRPFVFYPAQFWPHKNHAYILRALRVLRERGIEIDAVFSGGDQGGLKRVRALAQREGVSDNVKFTGFLPTEEIAQMYCAAIALVMPTYFGPSNIPPIEAETFGCHLIYSDLKGFREFAGPEAFYCDLKSPENLADLIVQVQALPKRPARMQGRDESLVKEQFLRIVTELSAKIAAWSD